MVPKLGSGSCLVPGSQKKAALNSRDSDAVGGVSLGEEPCPSAPVPTDWTFPGPQCRLTEAFVARSG